MFLAPSMSVFSESEHWQVDLTDPHPRSRRPPTILGFQGSSISSLNPSTSRKQGELSYFPPCDEPTSSAVLGVFCRRAPSSQKRCCDDMGLLSTPEIQILTQPLTKSNQVLWFGMLVNYGCKIWLKDLILVSFVLYNPWQSFCLRKHWYV